MINKADTRLLIPKSAPYTEIDPPPQFCEKNNFFRLFPVGILMDIHSVNKM